MDDFYGFILPISLVPTAGYMWFCVIFKKKAINVALAMGILWPAFFVVWLVKGVAGAVSALVDEVTGG